MNQKEQEILGRYAHWQSVIKSHGLQSLATIEEFLEVASCDGQGGCMGDSCSGGNGEGCVGDSCNAGGGDSGGGGDRNQRHQEFIVSLQEQRQQQSHLEPSA